MSSFPLLTQGPLLIDKRRLEVELFNSSNQRHQELAEDQRLLKVVIHPRPVCNGANKTRLNKFADYCSALIPRSSATLTSRRCIVALGNIWPDPSYIVSVNNWWAMGIKHRFDSTPWTILRRFTTSNWFIRLPRPRPNWPDRSSR